MMTSHDRHVVSNDWRFDCLLNSLCGSTLKSPHNWPFLREFIGDSRTKGQWRGKKLLFVEVIMTLITGELWLNTLRPRQKGRHLAEDTSKCIFLKENVRISIKFSLKFVPTSPIDNIPALFQIMAWRWPGDKPLSEAMMVSLLTHICVARPQWVKIEIAWELAVWIWERQTNVAAL